MQEKKRFQALSKLSLPPPPNSGNFFLNVNNNFLARITEPSNDDYDNDGRDNCDYYFDTFHDFGVKNDQKYHIT